MREAGGARGAASEAGGASGAATADGARPEREISRESDERGRFYCRKLDVFRDFETAMVKNVVHFVFGGLISEGAPQNAAQPGVLKQQGLGDAGVGRKFGAQPLLMISVLARSCGTLR